MESAITAVAGELVSRFISFAFNRFCSSSSYEGLEEKWERLRHLLMRAQTVVEEADARYITNSGILMQLKILSEAMYQGYHALDTLTFQLRDDEEASTNYKVGDSSISLCSATRLKRPRTVLASEKKDKVHAALHNLETVVANISEFVVLLCGCDERLSRRPYDAYLYIGNFMFGRHAEKQKLLNFLLQHNPSDDHAPPPVLPIIGALGVGKKTLVAHVCADERVRSKFASILHMNGDNFLNINDHEKALVGISSLVVVEFVSDVEDVKWDEFYSFLTRTTSTRSKVIIISKLGRLARFGSVRPIFLDVLSYEEFWYLFKNLAFGSADPVEHPRLAHIAARLAKGLHQAMARSLVRANALADVLRSNLNVQFWLSILNRGRKLIEKNLFACGQHPNLLLEQGREVDLTELISCPVISPLRILPYTSNALAKTELPKVAFGKLLLDPSVRPEGEFGLLIWESRLPPYTFFIHFVPNCTQDMREGHSLSGRKRHTGAFLMT